MCEHCKGVKIRDALVCKDFVSVTFESRKSSEKH